jgi:uncharacterized repeat protein (TIGR03837 family)
MTALPPRCDIFCSVIDNFGDAGVCLRLARQLTEEYGWRVCLWIDQPAVIERMVPKGGFAERLSLQIQVWPTNSVFDPGDIADVVIEAFACELPPAYLHGMARRQTSPVWLNLEYLSAEDWIDDCHLLPSPHPATGLSKHFFFPGFSERSGGLLCERDYLKRQSAFDATELLVRCGLSADLAADPDVFKISLFCYPHAPVEELVLQLANHPQRTVLLIAGGASLPTIGATHGRQLSLQTIPFLDQDDYDKLLWACNLNFVRGEDSFVRAQLAGKPLVWNIYRQEDTTHLEKLDAFVARAGLCALSLAATAAFWRAWNGAGELDWAGLMSEFPITLNHFREWGRQLHAKTDLTRQLVQFCQEQLK